MLSTSLRVLTVHLVNVIVLPAKNFVISTDDAAESQKVKTDGERNYS